MNTIQLSPEELFNKVINDEISKEDIELVSVPDFAELTKDPIKTNIDEYTKLQGTCKQILSKLNGGSYRCVERPNKFTEEDDDEMADSDLSSQINEQQYSISYRSNFEDIRSNSKVHYVCQNDEAPQDMPCYKTISEAIVNSMPGETIIIFAGSYNESIVIDRSLEIRAHKDNKNSKVEITAKVGDCVTLKANCGRIVGITLNCSTPGNTYCARSKSGCLELDDCYLFSECAGCVRVEESARLTASNCVFAAKNYGSTSLMPKSRSVFNACTFNKPEKEDNALVVGTDATCIAVDCKKILSTVVFRAKSRGMLLRCTITAPKGNGIVVHESAMPLIQECTISKCGEDGILFAAGSKGVANGNKIFANNRFGFLALAAEQFSLNNNIIEENMHCGIRITQGSKGDINNTTVRENKAIGVQIESSCYVRIKRSTIVSNASTGIHLKYNAGYQSERLTNVWINDSLISLNRKGIVCDNGCIVRFGHSRIEANKEDGVLVNEKCKAIFVDTTFSKNEKSQLYIKNDSTVEATSSIFSESLVLCIRVTGESGCVFTNCVIQNNINNMPALHVNDGAHVSIVDCTFKSNKVSLGLFNCSEVNVRNSSFQDCDNSIVVQNSANLIMQDGVVERGRKGLQIKDQGKSTLKGSTFIGCSDFGLFIEGEGATLYGQNSGFQACGKFCIIIHKNAQARFDDSKFQGASQKGGLQKSDAGLKINENANVILYRCAFTAFQYTGIDATYSTISITDSRFENCMHYPVSLTTTSASIIHNTFGGGPFNAILLKERCRAEIKNNIYGEMRNINFYEKLDNESVVDEANNEKRA